MQFSKTHSVSLSVEARITQTFIILEEDLTVEDIKAGLAAGSYVTSLNYDDANGTEQYICRVNEEFTLSRVARIKTQTTTGDTVVYVI